MNRRRARLTIACTLAVAWLLALGVRLYWLQVREYQDYAARAMRQQQAMVELSAPRGTIRDARGRTLAVSLEVESIFADPRNLREQGREPEATAARLAGLLGLGSDRQRALAQRLASDRAFVWVARKPDPARAAAVEAAHIPGVGQVAESRRYYPLESLAAHVLGFVGLDDTGLAGLEAKYDDVIRSQPGRREVLSDGLSGQALHPRLGFTAPRPGADLSLTLDATFQFALEHELASAVASSNARGGTAVVLDPHTGAVLAMAGVPSFDPNRYRDFAPKRWHNPVIENAFEPGSTFKLITLAAALERGVANLDSVLDCEMGALMVRGVSIRDHQPFGRLSVRQVLAKSSNVGAMKLALKVGAEPLFGTMRAFGIGRRTGIDLPGENAGMLKPVQEWGPRAAAYNSFGQGLTTTTLQMAAAFATVANGGRQVRPYVVAAIGGKPVEHTRGPHVLSAETVTRLRSALETVVEEGTATSAQVAGYSVAGKTGTAQVPDDHGYAKDRYIASFIGFVPANDPALVIAIVIDEPWPHYHGSQAAAPAFAAFAQRALLALGVPSHRQPPTLWPHQVPPPKTASGTRFATIPAEPGPAVPRRRMATAPGTVPDLIGLDKRQAVRAASGHGLALRLRGGGYVVRQAPPPGAPLEFAGATLKLWLTPSTPPAGEEGGP